MTSSNASNKRQRTASSTEVTTPTRQRRHRSSDSSSSPTMSDSHTSSDSPRNIDMPAKLDRLDARERDAEPFAAAAPAGAVCSKSCDIETSHPSLERSSEQLASNVSADAADASVLEQHIASTIDHERVHSADLDRINDINGNHQPQHAATSNSGQPVTMARAAASNTTNIAATHSAAVADTADVPLQQPNGRNTIGIDTVDNSAHDDSEPADKDNRNGSSRSMQQPFLNHDNRATATDNNDTDIDGAALPSAVAPASVAAQASLESPSHAPKHKRKRNTKRKQPRLQPQVSMSATHHMFQFTCKLLQAQHLEYDVRARELAERRAQVAATRATWEKKLRSAKRELRALGHPVDVVVVDATSASAAAATSSASRPATAAVREPVRGRTNPADASRSGSALSNNAAAVANGAASAATSLITMRDAFSSRQNGGNGALTLAGGANHSTTGTTTTHSQYSQYSARIVRLETGIHEALAARKRMVDTMAQNVQQATSLSQSSTSRSRDQPPAYLR